MKRTLTVLVLGTGLLVACSPSVTVPSPTPSPPITAAPTTAAAPTPPPTPSALPTPVGFVLPARCVYTSGPVQSSQAGGAPITGWEFHCSGAATPDLEAVQRVASAFKEQGWTACSGSGPGHGVWLKGPTETFVNQNAAGNPGLYQLVRDSKDCP